MEQNIKIAGCIISFGGKNKQDCWNQKETFLQTFLPFCLLETWVSFLVPCLACPLPSLPQHHQMWLKKLKLRGPEDIADNPLTWHVAKPGLIPQHLIEYPELGVSPKYCQMWSSPKIKKIGVRKTNLSESSNLRCWTCPHKPSCSQAERADGL